MRKSGKWMTIWDDRILEIAQRSDSVSAAQLQKSEYIQISRSQISRRLQALRNREFLNGLGNGVYQITDRGEQYLAGDYDAATVGTGEDPE